MSILVFPAVTMPVIADLGMPLEEVVRLAFFMYLCYGLGALPFGYIADRWQARKLLLIGVGAMGLGLLLTGLFPTREVIPPSLMLVGLGASVYHPVGMALISTTVRRRGYALGINGVFGNMGIAAAPFITGILTWLFSWELAFVILGVSTLAVTLLLSLIRIDETHHPVHSTRPSGDGDHVKYFIIMCVALIMGGLSYRGNTVLLPAYLEMNTTFFRNIIDSLTFIRTQGTATLAATVLTSLVFLMGIFGQLVGGKVADRYDLRYAYLGVHAAAVPFLLAMAFTTDFLLAFCAGMYVVFSLGMQPIENSLVAALTPARWRSTGFAIKFVLVFGVGATVVYWIGIVKTRYSVEAIYVFLAGIAFLLVLSIIALIVASRRVRYIRN
jgi:MFS family permease